MTDRAIVETIIRALAEYLKRDPSSITPAHQLRDDLGLDSMAVIELLYKIEEAFNLQIPDQDLPGLTSVGAVATYVEKRLSHSPSAAPKSATSTTPSKSAKPKKAKR